MRDGASFYMTDHAEHLVGDRISLCRTRHGELTERVGGTARHRNGLKVMREKKKIMDTKYGLGHRPRHDDYLRCGNHSGKMNSGMLNPLLERQEDCDDGHRIWGSIVNKSHRRQASEGDSHSATTLIGSTKKRFDFRAVMGSEGHDRATSPVEQSVSAGSDSIVRPHPLYGLPASKLLFRARPFSFRASPSRFPDEASPIGSL
jgi:hypothetical protein